MIRVLIVLRIAVLCAFSFAGCQSQDSSSVQVGSDSETGPACNLSDESLAARKAELQELTSGIVERKRLQDGLAFRFEPKPGIVSRLAKLVDLERDCCQFISFRIVVEDHNGPVWLELTAPESARARIDEYFGPSQNQ